MDKKGNFFGQVWINDNLLATNIVGKGFGYLELWDSDNIPEYEDLEKAEE